MHAQLTLATIVTVSFASLLSWTPQRSPRITSTRSLTRPNSPRVPLPVQFSSSPLPSSQMKNNPRIYGSSRSSNTPKLICSSSNSLTQDDARMNSRGKFWTWNGHQIRYRKAESQPKDPQAPIAILVHGFGGNCEHWRKNLDAVSTHAHTYAIDLLGYGYSAKPSPPAAFPSKDQLYTFETWGNQLKDFAREVARANPRRKVYFVCNSVGSVAGLQAAVLDPEIIAGVMLIDPSLRMLHWKKQFFLQRPLTSLFQTALRETPLGRWFFAQVATPNGVRSVLKQAYHDSTTVTDELVDAILSPGLLPGAVDVFLDFISYSGGPLPEDLIPKLKCPVRIVWGEKDPWEPIELGRKTFEGLPNIDKFVSLPNVGHCPMDEAPHVVNPLIISFIEETGNHATP